MKRLSLWGRRLGLAAAFCLQEDAGITADLSGFQAFAGDFRISSFIKLDSGGAYQTLVLPALIVNSGLGKSDCRMSL